MTRYIEDPFGGDPIKVEYEEGAEWNDFTNGELWDMLQGHKPVRTMESEFAASMRAHGLTPPAGYGFISEFKKEALKDCIRRELERRARTIQ